MRKRLGGIALMAAAAVTGTMACAQSTYPVKPIRMVIGFPPGGGTDIVGRIVGQKLGEALGQQVIADNRGGAAGQIAAEFVAKAAPDGYTVMMAHIAALSILPSLVAKLPYDPQRDFAAISLVAIGPNLLVVHPSVPVKTMQDFISHARANPGKMNYGSSGAGGPPHIAGEMLKSMAKINVTHIVYKGVAPALTATLGNEVQMTFTNLFSGQPHIKGGRLRVLAVTSTKRLQAAPEWPTIAESGVPGYEAGIWFGFLVPAGTPKPIVDVLHREITGILKLPDVSQTFISQGGEVIANTPAEFRKAFMADVERLGRVVRDAGIKAE